MFFASRIWESALGRALLAVPALLAALMAFYPEAIPSTNAPAHLLGMSLSVWVGLWLAGDYRSDANAKRLPFWPHLH